MGQKPISFVLENIQSPINMANIMRICHFFNVPLRVFDPGEVISEKNQQILHDFSSGSSSTGTYQPLVNIESLLEEESGRIIATSINPNAQSIHHFQFLPGDQIVLGNEYSGVSELLIEHADDLVTIPSAVDSMPKTDAYSPILSGTCVAQSGTPCLNVAIASAVIAYEINRQLSMSHALHTQVIRSEALHVANNTLSNPGTLNPKYRPSLRS